MSPTGEFFNFFQTASGNCRRFPFNYWKRLLYSDHVIKRGVIDGIILHNINWFLSSLQRRLLHFFRAHCYCGELISANRGLLHLSLKYSIDFRSHLQFILNSYRTVCYTLEYFWGPIPSRFCGRDRYSL